MKDPPVLLKHLRTVKVSKCDNELNKFLCKLSNESYKLEILEVKECEYLEQVFGLNKFDAIEGNSSLKFPNLNTMQLRGLPNLKCIWNPSEIVELGKLVKLEITHCGLLKCPLSNTFAGKLVLLEDLKIESCKMLEKVVEGGEETQERSFPRLKDLQLADLPMLIKFNSEAFNSRFPNLQRLRIEKCPKLNAFTTGFLSIKTTNERPSEPPPNVKMVRICYTCLCLHAF